MASTLLDTLGRGQTAVREDGFDLWREIDRVVDTMGRNLARQIGRVDTGRMEMKGFAQEVLKPEEPQAARPLSQPEPEIAPQPTNVIRVNRAAPTGFLNPISDAREDDEGFEIIAEFPGVRPADLEIEFSDGSLTLTAERRDIDTGEKKHHIKERSRGTFQRRFRIPFQANPDTIEAQFECGVVRVFVPHPPETKPRAKKIELKA